MLTKHPYNNHLQIADLPHPSFGFLVFAICLTAAVHSKAQEMRLYSAKNSNAFYLKNIARSVCADKNRILEITHSLLNGENVPDNYTVIKQGGDYVVIDNYKYWFFSDDSLMFVDRYTHETMTAHKKDDDSTSFATYNIRAQHLDEKVRFFAPLAFQNKWIDYRYAYFNFDYSFDSVVAGEKFRVLLRRDTSHHAYNEATSRFDIPDFYDVSLYYSLDSSRLKYIYATPMNVENNLALKYGTEKFEIHIRPTAHGEWNNLLKLFDFRQKIYSGYTHHNNIDNPPQAYHLGKSADGNNDSVLLRYPLMPQNGHTTTLQQENGWLLVYFWSRGCKPCIETLRNLSKPDSPIMSFIDSHNIKLMIIDPFAADRAMVEEQLGRYGIEHYAFCAKGLGKACNITVFPGILLVSPDKRIMKCEKIEDVMTLFDNTGK